MCPAYAFPPGWTPPRATRRFGTWQATWLACSTSPRRPKRTRPFSRAIQSMLTYAIGNRTLCSCCQSSCFSIFLKDGHKMLHLEQNIVLSEFRFAAQEEPTKSNFLRNISGCRQTVPGGYSASCHENYLGVAELTDINPRRWGSIFYSYLMIYFCFKKNWHIHFMATNRS